MTLQDAPGPLDPATQATASSQTSRGWPAGPRLLFWLALLLAALPGAYMLGRPFGPSSFDGWLGGWYGVAARNLATKGFWALHFAPYVVPDAPRFGLYLHHPVTMSNVWGLFVWLFGDHEWALRLPSVLATLLSVALCAKVGARLLGAWGGALTALMLASTPMFGLYSSQVHYEPFLLASSAGAYLLYLRYLETPSGRRLAALAGGLALSVLLGWFGALIAVPIALHLFGVRGRRALRPIALLFATVCSVAALHLLLALWIDPGAVREIARAAAHRAGDRRDDASAATFDWALYLSRHATFALRLYGPKALFLGLVLAGGALGWRRRRAAAVHALLLLVPGLLVVGVFRQASYQHAFLSFPLLLGTACGGALFLLMVAGRGHEGRRWRPALALVLGAAIVGAGQWSL